MVGDTLTKLVETEGSTLVIDKFGIGSGTMSFWVRWDRAVAATLALKEHPSYFWLKTKEATITDEAGGMSLVSASFEGVPREPGEENKVKKTYDLLSATSTEPIETHPNFAKVAGNPAGALNGSSWDETGKFTGFAFQVGDGKKMGVRSFLAPSVIYREVEVRSLVSNDAVNIDLEKLGKIDKPPPSRMLPTTLPEKANWLRVGSPAETVGDGVKITRSWRLSGPGGWDKDWYE